MDEMRALLDKISVVIENPTADLTATSLALAIAALIALIVVLVVIIFVLPRDTTGTSNRPSESTAEVRPQRASSPYPRRRMWLLLWIVTCSVFAVAYGTTSASAYCADSCHAMTGTAELWRSSTHAGVTCVRCHEGRLVLSAVSGIPLRARSVAMQLVGSTGYNQATVPGRRCLECHSAILTETSTRADGLRMSHREPLADGADCFDCHGAVGHEGSDHEIGMDECLRCHDGTEASAVCSLCHVRGYEGASERSDRVYGTVVLPESPTCVGCHSLESCDECHGLRMPHPTNFARAEQHAKAGAFNGRDDLCYGCHTFKDCDVCHTDFGAHGTDWRRGHQAYDDGTWCRACHEGQDFCLVCHPD